MFPTVTISLPVWAEEFCRTKGMHHAGDEAQMRFVIALAAENVRRGGGGPFGAAVFDEKGNLVAPGMNRVTAMNCSACHAEIMALVIAQKTVGRFDLSDGGKLQYTLVSTTEPCAMCLGAVPWSGVSRLVCGARDEDARAIGFDEGNKPQEWVAALGKRGIAVRQGVLAADAASVLRAYVDAGGLIYNSGPAKGPASGLRKTEA
ncbi:MAG: nucleoside deaminase [Nitrospiraceae bacterium]|nr:nucleoside deaminase [Nitrospiraceae bacterium]